jgi:hypothetical protein
MNLCFKCGEKWGAQHQCSATVQLHCVEELLEIIEGSNSSDSFTTAPDDGVESDQELLCLSQQAMSGTENNACFRLQGVIQNREVLILIDSGSSGNFISSLLAEQLVGSVPLPTPVRVKVANGGIIAGTHYIPKCGWSCQGAQFCTSVKILPIQCYDMILGMEWLKTQSPMHVDWEAKWMEVKQPTGKHQLFGISADTSSCHTITTDQLLEWDTNDALLYLVQLCLMEQQDTKPIPPVLEQLLSDFVELFEEPKGLPPKRLCDHKIPLLPGATPMKLRPYRYNPMQKNEIEKQVAELVRQGVLQYSSSPFASPVLLVKKKDLTWRLCQDFRRLNAMTVKNKYLLPVIDELLDELAGSQWFTSLDLRAGYHQISMAEGEEH